MDTLTDYEINEKLMRHSLWLSHKKHDPDSHIGERLNLDNVDLRKSAIDFTDTQLQHSSCKDTNFSGLDMSKSDFSYACLNYASFRGTILEKTKFTSTSLHNTDFVDAELFDAIFNECHIENANFEDAHCAFTQFLDTTFVRVNFLNAYISDANFLPSDFVYVNFKGTYRKRSGHSIQRYCGGLHCKIDAELAWEMAHHLCTVDCDDKEFIKIQKLIIEYINKYQNGISYRSLTGPSIS
jgi:hypothetical protein